MTVRIYGKSNTKVDTNVIRLAGKYYLERLLGKKSKKVNLVIKIVPKSDDWGIFFFPTGRIKSYEIELNGKMPKKKILETLAHECVHLKQWHNREMRDHKKDKVRWMGKLVRWIEPNFDNFDDYFDQPWEIEANGRIPGLYAGFARMMVQNGHGWRD